jgi:hypothetical protein
MKFKLFPRVVTFIFTGMFMLPSWADFCSTHEICTTNANCACMVAADNYNERNFYIDFQALEKGHNYECSLANSPTQAQFLQGESTFPEGTTFSHCTDNCLQLPVTFQLDTHLQLKEKDTLVLKYRILPSDYPSHITTACKRQD